ncbi:MAG: PEP-CTERM sorting domain-containing protein [Planctomycetia bacterium]
MRKLSFFTSLAVLLGMLCIPLAASAYDLSTFGDESIGDAFEGRLARYTTFVGARYGDTFVTNQSQGVYDYVCYPRGTRPTYRLNDGATNAATDTYSYADDRYAIYFSGENGYPEDFYGYKFKMGATVSSLELTQMAYADGGVFTSQPDVEVMDAAGNWSDATVSWDVPYDNTLGITTNYNITFTNPTVIYGVRVIGDALDDAGSPDQNGFVSAAELQVNGTLAITSQIDLENNLALNQTPLWTTHGTAYTTQYGHPERLTDGNCTISGGYETTWNDNTGGGFTADEEFAGVLFSEPQTDVAAVGIIMMMFKDGGYLTADTLRVEYLVQGGNSGDPNDWQTVTGLDLGTYDDNYTILQNAPFEGSRNRYAHSELLTFDAITAPIDGIRIIGDVLSPSGDDMDGFLGMVEFEAFAAVPEPSTVVLLLGALGSMILIVRRKK